MRQLGDELPYAATVEIEEFGEDGGVVHIAALILVEREGQKRISSAAAAAACAASAARRARTSSGFSTRR
jgi:hypothetical protein